MHVHFPHLSQSQRLDEGVRLVESAATQAMALMRMRMVEAADAGQLEQEEAAEYQQRMTADVIQAFMQVGLVVLVYTLSMQHVSQFSALCLNARAVTFTHQ
jgi:hypothetical protein